MIQPSVLGNNANVYSEPSPNMNFFEWLKGKGERTEKTLSIIVLLIELLLVFVSSVGDLSILITLVINIIFLGFFILQFKGYYRQSFSTRNFTALTEFKVIPNFNEIKLWKFEKRANESIMQFQTFELFLYSSAFLYLVIIGARIEHIWFQNQKPTMFINSFHVQFNYMANLLVHFLSYAGAIYILRCFYVMHFPTFTKSDVKKKLKVINNFWFGTCMLLAIELILTMPFGVLHNNYVLNTFYFEFICSLCNAVSLMLLFARFESRLLGIQPVVTMVLYIYAVLQVALPFVTESIANLFFEQNGHISMLHSYEFFVTIILIIYLVGKLVFLM